MLYRKADGTPAALEDACPHRKLPLSMGRIKGDHLECGYHGLTVDCHGQWVKVPGATGVHRLAVVRSYPMALRYGLLWLWMGEPGLADPGSIVQVERWGDPQWGLNQGEAMTMACHYLYVTDNLLDPSPVSWVHRSSFGNAACEEAPLQTTVADDGVTVSRWMRGVEPAPIYAPFLKFSGRCDRRQQYEVRFPGLAVIRAVSAPAGCGDDDQPLHAETFIMDSDNFMTPVDENTTRYDGFQLRSFAPGDEVICWVLRRSTSRKPSALISRMEKVERAIRNGVPSTTWTTTLAWRTRCPAKSGTRAKSSCRSMRLKAVLASACSVSSADSRNSFDDSFTVSAVLVNLTLVGDSAGPRGCPASSRCVPLRGTWGRPTRPRCPVPRPLRRRPSCT